MPPPPLVFRHYQKAALQGLMVQFTLEWHEDPPPVLLLYFSTQGLAPLVCPPSGIAPLPEGPPSVLLLY